MNNQNDDDKKGKDKQEKSKTKVNSNPLENINDGDDKNVRFTAPYNQTSKIGSNYKNDNVNQSYKTPEIQNNNDKRKSINEGSTRVNLYEHTENNDQLWKQQVENTTNSFMENSTGQRASTSQNNEESASTTQDQSQRSLFTGGFSSFYNTAKNIKNIAKNLRRT
ncbi:hypothetical protein GLOIN_2v1555598, partial [Rhizophagus irregularis DAOM 181602=DAOM 197198]